MAPRKRKSTKGTVKKTDTPGSSKETIDLKTNTIRPPLKSIPLNIVKQFDLFQRNGLSGSYFSRSGKNVVCERLKNYTTKCVYSVFNKRVTAISWHKSRVLFVAGSKAGDMTLFRPSGDNSLFKNVHFWPGEGPGLSILGINFPELYGHKMMTASIDGTVRLWDLETWTETASQTIMCSGTMDRWYCSVSSSVFTGLSVAGDSKGNLFVLDKDAKVISNHKLHKNKISTADFNNRDGWLFSTASLDKTVKLFDIRQLKTPVHMMVHDKGLNSAFFSKTNSLKLLTTDQNDKITVYSGATWEKCLEIDHPHRHYMYLTPIKASWHPQCDLIVVGRYPDPKRVDYKKGELSTIDIFNDSGELECQLFSCLCNGVLSLNEFNSTGEFLISAMGLYIPLWGFNDNFSNIKTNYIRSRKDYHDSDNDTQDDNFTSPQCKKSKRTKQSFKSNTKTFSK